MFVFLMMTVYYWSSMYVTVSDDDTNYWSSMCVHCVLMMTVYYWSSMYVCVSDDDSVLLV